MAKHTLKILRCEHRKILKYIWPFYNITHERVNSPYLSQNNFLRKTYYFLLDTHNLKDIKNSTALSECPARTTKILYNIFIYKWYQKLCYNNNLPCIPI